MIQLPCPLCEVFSRIHEMDRNADSTNQQPSMRNNVRLPSNLASFKNLRSIPNFSALDHVFVTATQESAVAIPYSLLDEDRREFVLRQWRGEYDFYDAPPKEEDLRFVIVTAVEFIAQDPKEAPRLMIYTLVVEVSFLSRCRRFLAYPETIKVGRITVGGSTLEKPWPLRNYTTCFRPKPGHDWQELLLSSIEVLGLCCNQVHLLTRNFRNIQQNKDLSDVLVGDDESSRKTRHSRHLKTSRDSVMEAANDRQGGQQRKRRNSSIHNEGCNSSDDDYESMAKRHPGPSPPPPLPQQPPLAFHRHMEDDGDDADAEEEGVHTGSEADNDKTAQDMSAATVPQLDQMNPLSSTNDSSLLGASYLGDDHLNSMWSGKENYPPQSLLANTSDAFLAPVYVQQNQNLLPPANAADREEESGSPGGNRADPPEGRCLLELDTNTPAGNLSRSAGLGCGTPNSSTTPQQATSRERIMVSSASQDAPRRTPQTQRNETPQQRRPGGVQLRTALALASPSMASSPSYPGTSARQRTSSPSTTPSSGRRYAFRPLQPLENVHEGSLDMRGLQDNLNILLDTYKARTVERNHQMPEIASMTGEQKTQHILDLRERLALSDLLMGCVQVYMVGKLPPAASAAPLNARRTWKVDNMPFEKFKFLVAFDHLLARNECLNDFVATLAFEVFRTIMDNRKLSHGKVLFEAMVAPQLLMKMKCKNSNTKSMFVAETAVTSAKQDSETDLSTDELDERSGQQIRIKKRVKCYWGTLRNFEKLLQGVMDKIWDDRQENLKARFATKKDWDTWRTKLLKSNRTFKSGNKDRDGSAAEC